MKNNASYLKYFLYGAVFGLSVTCATPKSYADYVGQGLTNIFFFGAIGYSILAIINKEYKKLWIALLIFLLSFLLPFIVFSF